MVDTFQILGQTAHLTHPFVDEFRVMRGGMNASRDFARQD
jgi:hypothetical protein